VSSHQRHERVQLPHLAHSLRPSRQERVAKQLREEISQLMLEDMKDPRVRMASISEVVLTPDLRRARVMVSAVGSDEQRHGVVKAMQHAQGFIRAELGQRLENLKTAPQLHFELDESIAYSVHINSVLKTLHPHHDSDGGGE
jgi:ribosome-binding factor A